MAIEFVGGNTASKLGATSGNSTIALNSGLTGGIASSASSGDLVIAVFASASTVDRTLAITDGTNNYTLIDSEYYIVGGTYDTNLRVAYKFITSDTDTTFGPTGATSDSGTMAVYVFRNVGTATPLDGVTPTTSSSASTAIVDPATITPSSAGAYIVVVGAGAHAGGSDTYSSSDLTDFRSVGQNGTNDSSLGIGHKPDWTSGGFDPAAWTFTQATNVNQSYASVSFVLRPIYGLLANDVESASSVTKPAITQAHVLNANDVQSASSLSAPALTQVVALLADDVQSASSVSVPVMAQVHALLAGDVESASSVSIPVVGQIHALTANDAESASSLSAPALAEVGETDVLLAEDVEAASQLSKPTLAIVSAPVEAPPISGPAYHPNAKAAQEIYRILFGKKTKASKKQRKAKQLEEAALKLLNDFRPEEYRPIDLTALNLALKNLNKKFVPKQNAGPSEKVQAIHALLDEAEQIHLEIDQDDEEILLMLAA